MIETKKLLKNRFSLGYHQFSEDASAYYQLLKNASQEYRDEISDLYFSAPYFYEGPNSYDANPFVRYGDCMSAPTKNEEHIDYLFKIQDELGISISLTFNETPPHPALTGDREIFDGFVEHIRKFYDRGLRMCTISDIHMMGTGRLQEEFPEMHWKNTVNNIVRSAQGVMDFYALGFRTVLIDRSLNRDLDEIKKIGKLKKTLPDLKISLLAREGCMPSCPFKLEHDSMGAVSQNRYWAEHGTVSCTKWRFTGEQSTMPRIGTDLVAIDEETYRAFAEVVDVFKYSGRNGKIPELRRGVENYKFVWGMHYGMTGDRYGANENDFSKLRVDEIGVCDSFEEIMNEKFYPLTGWFSAMIIPNDFDYKRTWPYVEEALTDNIWNSKKGKSLNKILSTCENQCWDCHACEKVFGVKPFDSLIEFNRPKSVNPRIDAKEIKVISLD
jgi:MoaA/NifB/PqqE/SkfB family radical SAM enzyme